ncbi:DUF4148 domain-containing protein [Burkholderia contaminans]|uniref:DUF4148 domain-containing protein n=1 Tax=Burkholderia contaminans TaxID=488447 RepID=UPI0009E53E9F|nr:DUF4148 domain-containing protein [Burkholderia contaminans]MEB4634290.1 DUF4148 domain-containing protein [Burkholderia contaminans]MEB4642063.1 DUF4148 domain-containing protein [Burkholderia contaminans]MEB4657058.1 DUF4148 domain-containing protein [Burkholderia contaminans]MEB4665095.1 DUF4148 domain-containing protein [Burkholderia contaminans]MEB4672392.1 DUF4148 domain-containing protein [Burkholderia contaminans]
MKIAIRTMMLAAVIVPTIASAAQSGNGLTRAEVRAQIARLEQAGYNPARKDVNYPRLIQQAEARVQSSEATRRVDASGYGSAQPEGSGSGPAVHSHASARSLYLHH